MDIELPATFEDAVRERRLLPFVGAGFSKNIDSDFPSWSQMIKQSADLLDYDPEILSIQGDYLQIAEYLGIKRELGTLYNILSRKIDDEDIQVDTSKPHLLLPYLDVQSIFTTNWDRWIERGFENQRIPYSKIITHYDFVSPKSYKPKDEISISTLYSDDQLVNIKRKFKEATIVKYHGDFSEHDSIVFAESQYYDRQDFEHPLDIKLRAEIIGRSVLFIGYSFSDPNIRYIWHKLNKMMEQIETKDIIQSFFVTHLNNPLQIELFRKKNIETILLSPKNIRGDLEKLLEHIIELQMR